MALSSALRPVVANLTSTFGRTAYIVHRSAGTFDPETGRRARAMTREKVAVVIDKGTTSEQTVSGAGATVEGLSESRVATLAAADVTARPTTEAVLEIPSAGSAPEVWQIMGVDTVEEGGVAISYELDIRR